MSDEYENKASLAGTHQLPPRNTDIAPAGGAFYLEAMMVKEDIGTEAKECVDFFHDLFVETTGDEPIMNYGMAIKNLKIILKKYDVEAVKEVMTAFFEWPRTDYTFLRFYNRFNVVRYKLKEKNGR